MFLYRSPHGPITATQTLETQGTKMVKSQLSRNSFPDEDESSSGLVQSSVCHIQEMSATDPKVPRTSPPMSHWVMWSTCVTDQAPRGYALSPSCLCLGSIVLRAHCTADEYQPLTSPQRRVGAGNTEPVCRPVSGSPVYTFLWSLERDRGQHDSPKSDW